MSAALDRLTNSVNDAVAALSEATSTAGAPTDDAALNTLADNLDAAVSAYKTATTPNAA